MTAPTATPRGSSYLPGQLVALVRLRWTMVRSRRQRWLLVLVGLLPFLLVAAGILAFGAIPPQQAFNVLLVTPTIYLTFLGLSFLVPLASGGGYELYPADQMVAYPIRARTHFLSTLTLVPANLAWVLNVTGLLVLTTVTAGPVDGGTLPLIASVGTFVVMATVVGHAFGWGVIGIRQTRRGRLATWGVAATLGLVVLVTVRAGEAFPLLDRSPTRYALLNALNGYAGAWRAWLMGLAVMVAVTAAAGLVGVRLTRWTLRRPGDRAILDASRRVRRRPARGSVFWELVSINRAAVWRTPALRRGTLVLLLLPGTVAMVSGLTWSSLVLLPGLVAAGAGLLFGINAFGLDSGGAVWLSTLPQWAQSALGAKAWVVAEVTLLAATASILGGAVRAPAPTSAGQVTATLGCGIAAGALVVASSMKSSVRHPHRAELLGPRDTPAPPGAMVGYSVKLAIVCTVIGLLFSGSALSGMWWVPFVLDVPFLAWGGLSLIDTQRLWALPSTRARVVLTVSGG